MADPQSLSNGAALEYKKFLDHVQESFKKRCEEIKEKTNKALDATAAGDVESRKNILIGQKQELDSALAELKQLLDVRSREAREKLEEIAKQAEAQSMDLDAELAALDSTKK